MASIGTVEGYLVLTDQFTVVLDRAMTALQKASGVMSANLAMMNKALDTTSRTAKRASHEVEKSARAIDTLNDAWKRSRAAYALTAVGIGLFVREVVQAQQATDRMFNSMLVATGSATTAREELAFVREEANRLGLSLSSAGVLFGQLAAASKGTGISMNEVRGVFTAVSEAATALGLSSEVTQGALNALVQMMTKGTVQAEELRGQLGDRIPGAVQIMARALGVSTRELNKMMEAGQIITAEVLPKFAEEMRRTFSAGVLAGSQSFNAQLNRLKTTFFDFFASVAESAELARLLGQFNELVNVLKDVSSSNVTQWFGDMSQAVGDLSEAMSAFLRTLSEVKDAFRDAFDSDSAGAVAEIGREIASMIDQVSDHLSSSPLWRLLSLLGRGAKEMADTMEENFTEVLAATEGFHDKTKEIADKMQSEVWANFGAPELAFDQKAVNDHVKNIKDILDGMIKKSKEHRREFDKAYDLEDKLKNQAKELKVFQKVLAESGGDFDKAEKNAASFYAILKAGLNPLEGWGKELYEIAKANDAVALATEAAKDAQKEYLDGIKFQMELRDKWEDDLREDAEKAQKRADELSTTAKQNISDLKDLVAAETAMLHARNKGTDAVRQAQKELDILREIQSRIPADIEKGSEEYNRLAAEIRAVLEPLLDLQIAQDKLREKWGGLADVFRTVDFGSDELNKVGDSVGNLIDAFTELAIAGTGSAEAVANAWSAGLQTIQAVLEATGAFNEGNGGGFGGSSEGNYAAEGQMIGAVIGGVIGAFAGMPQVGMAIGGAAGGMLGGFIKKGADEALATITFDTGAFTTNIKKAEGNLRGSMDSLSNSIVTSLQKIVDSIGGTIENMPMIDMKIRDGIIRVFVGGVKGVFEDMQQAVSFVVAEMLKQGEISGIDEMIAAALKGTTADSLEGLASDLDAVMKVLSFGMNDAAEAIMSFTNEMDALRNQMIRLLGDSDQLARALSNISMEEANRWQNLRDQITGHQKSNAELRKMKEQEALLFNAEKALRIAELKIKLDSLKAMAEIAKGQAGLAQINLDIGQATVTGEQARLEAYAGIAEAGLDLYRAEFGVRSDLVDATRQLLLQDLNVRRAYVGTSYELLAAQIAALEQVIAALEAIPDIQLPEIRLPGTGGGLGAGGFDGPSEEEQAEQQRLDDLERLWDQLRDIFSSALPQWTASYNALKDEMAEQIELAHDDAAALAAINAAFELQVHMLEEEAIDALGLATEGIIDQFADLGDTLMFLADQGRLTEAMIRELGDSMFISLADGLLQYVENEDVRMVLEDLKFRMQMYQYELQFQALQALNLLTKEQIEIIAGLMGEIWDAYEAGTLDFQTPDLPDYGGGGGQQEDPTDELLDQLIASIEDLRATLQNYQDFLTSLERGPLSGATLRQSFESAQTDFMEMLALAQGGDMDAIRNLPGMAEEFLGLAAEYLDPSSAAYQQILAMVQSTMGGIAGGIEDIVDAAPESALGSNGVLDTIAEILAAMASRWGVNPGWNTGNVAAGTFPWNGVETGDNLMNSAEYANALLSNSSGASLTTHSPGVELELRRMRQELNDKLSLVVMAEREQTHVQSAAMLRRGDKMSGLSKDAVA